MELARTGKRRALKMGEPMEIPPHAALSLAQLHDRVHRISAACAPSFSAPKWIAFDELTLPSSAVAVRSRIATPFFSRRPLNYHRDLRHHRAKNVSGSR